MSIKGILRIDARLWILFITTMLDLSIHLMIYVETVTCIALYVVMKRIAGKHFEGVGLLLHTRGWDLELEDPLSHPTSVIIPMY